MFNFACIPKSRTDVKWFGIFFVIYTIDGDLSIGFKRWNKTEKVSIANRNRAWWSSPKFLAVFFKTCLSSIRTPVECSHISCKIISVTNKSKNFHLFYDQEILQNIQQHETSRVELWYLHQKPHSRQFAFRWYSYLRLYSTLNQIW